MFSWAAKKLEFYFLLLSTTDQYACVWCKLSEPAVQCCGMHLLLHDGVDKMRVHSVVACAHADVLHVHMLPYRFIIQHTRNPKEQVEHCCNRLVIF